MVEVENGEDSLRYFNNNLQMNKLQKHFPLMLNELQLLNGLYVCDVFLPNFVHFTEAAETTFSLG